MPASPSLILDELAWRGLIHQSTDRTELADHLSLPRTLYCGFDPTAPSLHVGHFLPLMMLRRFQRFGHTPIAVVGGATGMVGDPSGKSEERNLLTRETLAANLEGMRTQMQRFLDFSGSAAARLVDNHDWTAPWSFLDFLRDIGKHVSVNAMMARESVKARLERPDAGISYTEFSYQLLQAFDFAQLYRQYGCTLQIGGSDQWGNITAGIDLARRLHGAHLHGMTCPLLTTADGRKMGKTERGALWLDPARTTPYAFYQYWINVADADVGTCLRYLTELSREQIDALLAAQAERPDERPGQKALARWMTEFVHGAQGVAAAERATAIFFGAEIERLSDGELNDIFADVPSSAVAEGRLASGFTLVDALVHTGLCTSKGEARRALAGGAVALNNRRVDSDRPLGLSDRVSESMIVLRNGKKRYALLRLET